MIKDNSKFLHLKHNQTIKMFYSYITVLPTILG